MTRRRHNVRRADPQFLLMLGSAFAHRHERASLTICSELSAVTSSRPHNITNKTDFFNGLLVLFDLLFELAQLLDDVVDAPFQ
jgi:hypothetical protein